MDESFSFVEGSTLRCKWRIDAVSNAGADPETSNIAGQNALMAATEFKHVDVVDLLLSETQISIESKNVDGETALIYGALTGDVETVECLCEFGANVNAESYSKDSPLKRACRNQDVPMIHKLLDFAATRRPSRTAHESPGNSCLRNEFAFGKRAHATRRGVLPRRSS